MNLHMCRQVTRRVRRSVDVSLDECRQMQTRVDESKILTLIPERAGHIGMLIFNFVVSSVITAHHSVLSPRISKTHLPISSLNVRELKLN